MLRVLNLDTETNLKLGTKYKNHLKIYELSDISCWKKSSDGIEY